MNSRLTIPSTEARTIEVVAKVTRYPKELLSLDVDLEDELGIDSVKLQEILAALEQAFPGVPALPERERPRTLRDFVIWIEKTQPTASDTAAPRHDDASAAPELVATNALAVAEHSARDPLAGKIVLVSGSGHGLGRATALELARRGATVVVNSFHHRELGDEVARAIGAQGGQAHHIWASMARPDQVDRLFDELGERFGGLDMFIHNASNGAFAKLGDVTEEQWLKSFRTNVVGFHRGALRAAALMRKRGGGKILTLSSVYEDATVDYFGVQGPVKAALESLTRFLAKELLNDNIQVNCLSFGALEGRTMNLYPEAERICRETEARSQGKRRMTEFEAARAQLLFLSPDADSITGSTLRIDRGMMLSW